MKKIILCCIIFIFILTGCAAPIPADKTEKDLPAGDKIETDKFLITAQTGWNKLEIPGGFQLYKGNDILEISITGMNMTEDEDKAAMERLIKQYSGTPIENVTMWDLQFKKTTYTANNIEQSIYTCIRSGEQVKIQIGGNIQNKEISQMLETVQFK